MYELNLIIPLDRLVKHQLGSKPMDFQIRVRVVEGRQLSGGVTVAPTASVFIAGVTKKTKVVKATNAPTFNETFFFNFNMEPNKLFDENAVFQVD